MLKVLIWYKRPTTKIPFYQFAEDRSDSHKITAIKFWDWVRNSGFVNVDNLHLYVSEDGLTMNAIHYFEDDEEYELFSLEYEKLVQGEPFNGKTLHQHPDFVEYNERNGITSNVPYDKNEFEVIEI